MNSLMVHIARLRWRGGTYFNRWMARIAPDMPGWAMSLFFGDTRIVVLSSDAGELRAELWPFGRSEGSLLCAVLHDGCWKPERTWQALRAAEPTCPVVLSLPQDLTLAHEIRVPLTALENLEGTIRHGLTTWTPFSHSEVHVSARPRAIESHQVVVDLRYALRDQVQDLLDRFATSGLRADRLSLDGRIVGAAIIDNTKKRRIHRQHLVDGLLLALASFLVLASALQVWSHQDLAMTDLQDVIRHEAAP